MEKILIRENEGQQIQIVQRAKEEAQNINTKLAPAMAALGVELDDEAFKDCILSDCEETRTVYFGALEADLENIKNPGVRDAMRQDAREAFTGFTDTVRTLKAETTLRQFLSISDGVCILTPDNEAALLDSVKTYAVGAEQIEAYNQLKAIIDALNDFHKGNIPPGWQAIFEIKDGVFYPNSQIDYSWIVERRKNK